MSYLLDLSDTNTQYLETVLDWVRWGASQFTEAGLVFGHGTDNAWDEAWFLLSWSISQPWDIFDKVQHARLSQRERTKVAEIFRRRIQERVPAPYITGVAWFAGYPYKVSEDVLVPRSPIAELILQNFEPWLTQAPTNILDLCTGSGCIGIACAHQFEQAQVELSDISSRALIVAKQNIDFHQVNERVSCIESDGFDALHGRQYDVIVSNPPYVDAQDFASMPEEFRAEPEIGLSSGEDGLSFTRHLLANAENFLKDDGLLVVEVGNSWPALEQAFPHLAFTWPELESGGHGVFVLTKAQLAHC